jgi:hypothetical protein
VLRSVQADFRELPAHPATTSEFKQIELFDLSASSEKLACSVGDSPTGERVRDPVAWVAFVEETKRMKPTDKAILGMVSESPGRNVSEPRSGLDKKIIRRPSPLWSGEGSMTWRRLTEAACHFGGVVGTCVKKARKRRAVRRDEGRPLGVAL